MFAQGRIQSPPDQSPGHESLSSWLSIDSSVPIPRYSLAMAHLYENLWRVIPNPTYVELIFLPDSMRCALLQDLLLDKHPAESTDGFGV